MVTENVQPQPAEGQLPAGVTLAEGETTPQIPVSTAADGAVAQAAEGAVQQPVEAQPQQQTPQQRMRSEEEFRRFQAQMDRQVAAERQGRILAEQQAAMAYEQAQMNQDAQFVKAVQEQGGDVNAAQQIVAQRAALRQQSMQVQQMQAQQQATLHFQDQAAKTMILERMARDFGVKPQDIADASTPQAAAMRAAGMRLARLEAQAKGGKMQVDSGMPLGRGFNESTVRGAYADGKIDTATYEKRMKALGKEP